jgi:hypothetical protein
MNGDEARTVRVQLLLTPSEAAAIDEWGFARRMRFRNGVIRELMRLGMRSEAATAARTANRSKRKAR